MDGYNDTYAEALDTYRFWMNCIKFAPRAEFTPDNICRWARYAGLALSDAIGFASR